MSHFSNLSRLPSRSPVADKWYSLSYLYFSPVGTIIAVSVGLAVSLVTGWLKTNCVALFIQFKN